MQKVGVLLFYRIGKKIIYGAKYVMQTFRQYVGKWDVLLEQISDAEIQQITKEITPLLGNYTLDKVLLAKNVTTAPQIKVVQGEPGAQLFKQDNIIRNYRHYFPDAESFTHAEILKFEFVPNYQWFMVLMGFTNNGLKLAHMAFSPDIHNVGLIKTVGNILRKHDFRIFPQQGGYEELHSSTEFLDRLVTIFRNFAGRYYSSSMFRSVKEHYEALKKEDPQGYAEFEKRKNQILGAGIEGFRRVGGIAPNTEWETPGGGSVPISELKEGDEVYYHPGGRYFSQWAQEGKAYDMAGILSSDAFEVRSKIPTHKIVYTNLMIPAGFSPHVGEGEIIVEHPNPDDSDKELLCTVTKNRTSGGG